MADGVYRTPPAGRAVWRFNDAVELKLRDSAESEQIPLAEAVTRVRQALATAE